MHYYKRNIGDYAKKAGKLSMLQHGSYTLLIDACYDREKFPTMEEAIDWCWATTPEEIAAVQFVLTKFFSLEDGRYTQARILEEIQAYHGKCKTNQDIAFEREQAKKERKANETSTIRAHDVNESAPNQEPLTINQEPIKTHTSGTSVPNCPHLEIIEAYNSILGQQGLPIVRPGLWAGSKREIHLRARWKEDSSRQTVDFWERFFSYVAKSDFLMGRLDGQRTWRADLGWLINRENFDKVFQGNYHE